MACCQGDHGVEHLLKVTHEAEDEKTELIDLLGALVRELSSWRHSLENVSLKLVEVRAKIEVWGLLDSSSAPCLLKLLDNLSGHSFVHFV